MDLRLVKKLISLLEDSQLSELSLEQEGFSLSLKKAAPPLYQQPLSIMAPQAPAQQTPPPETFTGIEITAPMVGTFYHASAPDKPPYVKVGDRITKGTTVGIIEAMKMMNALPSPVSGVVEKICVPNAAGVEFGQVLLMIRQD